MATYRNFAQYYDALQHVLAGIADGSIIDDAEALPSPITDLTDANAALAALLAAADKVDLANPNYNLPAE